MKLIQAELEQNGSTLIAWIDHTKKLKEGKRITLKGKEGWWNVVKLYDLVRDSDSIDLDREQINARDGIK